MNTFTYTYVSSNHTTNNKKKYNKKTTGKAMKNLQSCHRRGWRPPDHLAQCSPRCSAHRKQTSQTWDRVEFQTWKLATTGELKHPQESSMFRIEDKRLKRFHNDKNHKLNIIRDMHISAKCWFVIFTMVCIVWRRGSQAIYWFTCLSNPIMCVTGTFLWKVAHYRKIRSFTKVTCPGNKLGKRVMFLIK